MERYATLAESRERWKYTRSVLADGVVAKGVQIEVCGVSGGCFVRTVDPTKIIVFRHDGHTTFACIKDSPKHWYQSC